MAVTVYLTAKNILCQAIENGSDFYQETLRGTDKETLVPALAARASYHGANQIGWYFGAYNQNKILVGLGLAWAFCAYKGLGERVWLKEWGALAFAPVANAVVDYVTAMSYQKEITTTTRSGKPQYRDTSYLSHVNQDRAQFVLKTVVYMVQAYALYKFKGERNTSLPLKPYLYYGAGVVLLTRLNNRYNPDANSATVNLSGTTPLIFCYKTPLMWVESIIRGDVDFINHWHLTKFDDDTDPDLIIDNKKYRFSLRLCIEKWI